MRKIGKEGTKNKGGKSPNKKKWIKVKARRSAES